MYEDDRFNPATDNDNYSLDSNRRRKAVSEFKKGDKNYFKLVQPFNKIWRDGREYKNITIELHGSGQHGTYIRNAVTGHRTNYVVGTSDEDYFFKVSDCRGIKGTTDPIHLYYDSPEQYENHYFIELNQNIKDTWREKYNNAFL